MLRKLLKYEAQATARIFVPLFALLIIFALINKAFLAINSDKFGIPQGIAMFVFVAIIVAISVMTLVVSIVRFYKNLLKDEGYLMFTLPVEAHSNITSKLLISSLWTILSVIVSGFAILLIAANPDSMANFSKGMSAFWSEMNKVGFPAYVILIEGIVLVLLSTVGCFITIYAAMAIGNLSGKHRVLLSLGAFIGFSTIEQIIGSIILVAVPHNWYDVFDHVNDLNYLPAVRAIEVILLAMIIFTLVFSVAYYILTNYLLKKKLNLE
jgi:preprotein translocase subunit SecE